MSKRKAVVDLRPKGVLGALKEITTLERSGFIVDVDEQDAKLWRISLTKAVLGTHGLMTLVAQLKTWAQTERKLPVIVLEVRFAANHPCEPPFVRVVRPRFEMHTGHVTVGGSICTKLVTTDGWRSDISTEALLRSILENMNDGNARIDMRTAYRSHDYLIDEALAAFKRVAAHHGWAEGVSAV
jgi:ubiquitin-conjugating enzyme E2 Q